MEHPFFLQQFGTLQKSADFSSTYLNLSLNDVSPVSMEPNWSGFKDICQMEARCFPKCPPNGAAVDQANERLESGESGAGGHSWFGMF